MENLKISVIVPVYNRLEHLRALFICLLNQATPPHELIISDDGSSESVEDYIGDLIGRAKFKIKHIYQEDLGFRKTRALNNAVRESEGNFLAFCDQDLIMGNDYIETILKLSNKKEFIHFRPYNLTEEEKLRFIEESQKENFDYHNFVKSLPQEYKESVLKTLKKDRIRRMLNIMKLKKRGIKLVGMSYALSKENFLKVNGYDEMYRGWGYEDDDFGNRLCTAGIRGKDAMGEDIQLHLWHPFDSSKKKSQNEDYYSKRKKEIIKDKDYFCLYGLENGFDKDRTQVKVLKENL